MSLFFKLLYINVYNILAAYITMFRIYIYIIIEQYNYSLINYFSNTYIVIFNYSGVVIPINEVT